MKIYLSNPDLFFKKVLTLFLATVLLVPLIQFKLLIPAMAYVGGLIILHLFFFYIYFSNVPWREISKDKKSLILRLVAVLFFIYLLTLLKFQGNSFVILFNISAAFFIHLLILFFMMTLRISRDQNRLFRIRKAG